MNTLRKQIKGLLLLAGLAMTALFAGTLPCDAAAGPYYENYYNQYEYYYGYYSANPTSTNYNVYYLGFALPYWYYYYAGWYGDYYGYNSDSLGSKSDKHIQSYYYSASTNHDNCYNSYAYDGDWYWRNF